MQKTSKKLSATPIPSTEKYLYGFCVIVNKKLSSTFDAVKLTPSTHNTVDHSIARAINSLLKYVYMLPFLLLADHHIILTRKHFF